MTHIVQAGESLYSIASQYGTSFDAIMRANGLSSPTLYVGQRMFIPTGQAQPPGQQPTGFPGFPGFPGGRLEQRVDRLEREVNVLQREVNRLQNEVNRLDRRVDRLERER